MYKEICIKMTLHELLSVTNSVSFVKETPDYSSVRVRHQTFHVEVILLNLKKFSITSVEIAVCVLFNVRVLTSDVFSVCSIHGTTNRTPEIPSAFE
jgi:hypothetical protein